MAETNVIEIVKLLIKRGLEANKAPLDEGELGLTTDTKKVAIGTDEGDLTIPTSKNLTDELLTLKEHQIFHYQLEGEDTTVAVVKKDNGAFTIWEVQAPTEGELANKEATITLMRKSDPDTGMPEFLDIYNMNYPDGDQMGIRVQTRGEAGILKKFVVDFNKGQGIYKAVSIHPDKLFEAHGNIRFSGENDQITEFYEPSGTRIGYLGYIVSNAARKMFRWLNLKGGNSFELHDNGSIVTYSPTGSFYVYTDNGFLYVNEQRVQTQEQTILKSPDGSLWKASISDAGEVTWAKS